MFDILNAVFTNITTFENRVMNNVPAKGAIIVHLHSLLLCTRPVKSTVDEKSGKDKTDVTIWTIFVIIWCIFCKGVDENVRKFCF